MPAPVSIIIPTLNAASGLGPTLEALIPGVVAGVITEVVIADGGSEDDTRALAEMAGATWIDAPRGRGSQLAAGAEAARGAWFLFLHADSRPDPGWIDAISEALEHPDQAAAFRLRFASDAVMARVTAGWANLRSRVFALPYGDQGLLISRHHYHRIGGYDRIPLMEDVAIARRIGRNIRLLPATVTTSPARYQRRGWIRQGAGNLMTLARYAMGTPVDVLARAYGRGDTARDQDRDSASPN